ncbi:MAG: circadian clock protein KaiA [Microcoleaceae cyanobacterium]
MERETGSQSDSKVDNLTKNSSVIQNPQILLCVYAPSKSLNNGVIANIQQGRYALTKITSITQLVQYVVEEHHQVDCLVIENSEDFVFLADQLQQQYIFLPIVVVNRKSASDEQTVVEASTLDPKKGTLATESNTNFVYHSNEVEIDVNQLDRIDYYIDQAIRKFVTHAVTTRWDISSSQLEKPTELTRFIESQQRRLAEKLHERLGYLGVYYKRNSRNFLRNLSATDRQDLLDQLKSKYRQIVLNYFSKDPDLNQKIDEYVNIAFFADLPISRVVEIHMELMDQLSKQLKLEGRSEELLLDYRLTLIDVMAHVCEMYRRSIPNES